MAMNFCSLIPRIKSLTASTTVTKHTYFSPAISSVYRGQSLERVPANCDTDSAADWQPSRNPAPGTINLDGQCSPVAVPAPAGDNLLSIGQIQGIGDISPYVNQQVEFRGLVTGFLEDRNSCWHHILHPICPGHARSRRCRSPDIRRPCPILSVASNLNISSATFSGYPDWLPNSTV